ncbi:hypothetical protein [Sphingomonas sp.]|uniref:hypothetical protein n=1 Tax=Sphingomonas sp. TaxID=28214 RepID=UPI003B3A4321
MDQSAAYNAGVGVGFLLSLLVIYGVIFAVGLLISRWLTRRRGDGRKVRWPLWIAIALIALMLLGQLASMGHG